MRGDASKSLMAEEGLSLLLSIMFGLDREALG